MGEHQVYDRSLPNLSSEVNIKELLALNLTTVQYGGIHLLPLILSSPMPHTTPANNPSGVAEDHFELKVKTAALNYL